jgi:hypothetical protein
MARLRDEPGFDDLFAIAARDLGQPAPFLEKDYWVTQILRSVAETTAGGFVLKGGTSLSKGYGIINRFSEDVDILLVPHADASARETEASLLAITERAAADLGTTWDADRVPGRGAHASRGDNIHYTASVDPTTTEATGIRYGAVLLETRYGDGHEPAEMVAIRPNVAAWAGLGDPDTWEDLAPVTIRVLEPRRTLLEKVVGVHHAACTWTEANPPNMHRFGRHYFDIWSLLAHRPTIERLADRARFATLLAEIERISDRYYGGHSPRPEAGFGDSVAFVPEKGTPLRDWLEASYASSLSLLAPQVRPPTFGGVLKRIGEHRDLL